MDDKKKNNPGDDLLEGFDDAFDGGIDQADQGNFVDAAIHVDEKTEFYDKEDVAESSPKIPKVVEKTEVVFKDDMESSSDEQKTQIEIKDDSQAEINSPGFEPTRNAVLPKIPTEDLASLFEEQAESGEGNTEDAITFDSTKNEPTRVPTEDLSSLMEQSIEIAGNESRTENFSSEVHDSDLMGRSGPVSKPAEPKKKDGGVFTSDFSSLIEEEISGKHGQTEDLSSLIQSDAIEGVTDDEAPSTKPLAMAPKPITPGPPKKNVGKDANAAFENSISPMEAEEDSKTIRVKTTRQKIMIGGIIAGLVAIVGGGAFVFLKSKKTAEPAAITATPEKVVDSQELLKELEEKYHQSNQYFISDRYQNYSEGVSKLEEIINIYPNHQKANARLAEAILLKFDGYLDSDRKNRVYQLLEKAENVDANSVETLRAKARLLMVEGKYKDAVVRIQQALNQSADEPFALQTFGEIQLAGGDEKAAQESFARVMQLQPDLVRPQYYYFLTKEKLGDLAGAKQGMTKLSSDTSTHAKSSIERFAIEMKAGDVGNAKEGLQQFLKTKETELGPSEAAKGWKLVSAAELKSSNIPGAIEALEKSVFKMPLDAEAAYQLGQLYFRQNNFEKSSQHYSTAVTLDPEKSEYLLQLGISLREQGRLKEAEENLKKLTTKEPKNFEALYQHAYTKYKLGFVDDVIIQLQDDLKENPGFLQGKILLGDILLEKNDLSNALKNFQDALSASKDRKITTMALISLGNYHLRQELWSKAKDYYLRANEKDSDNYNIHKALAKIDMQLGNIPDAQNHLQKMEKISPGNVDVKILEGNLLVRKKEYDKAIESFKSVIEKRDNDYETRVELAKVYLEKERYADALQELLVAYRFNADYFYTYYYMGIAHRGLNDLTESERNLVKAISLMPKYYKAHYELGVTYLKRDDIKKGAEELGKALALQPGYTPALVDLGDYYYERNVFTTANKYYSQALLQQPKDTSLLLKQAKTYHEINNDKKAIELFKKILTIRPNSAETHYELGILFEENNNFGPALQSYQRSAALNPKNPKPFYQLGFLYRAIGQNSKAVQAFRTYLQLSPDSAEKEDIEDQIRKLTAK